MLLILSLIVFAAVVDSVAVVVGVGDDKLPIVGAVPVRLAVDAVDKTVPLHTLTDNFTFPADDSILSPIVAQTH